MVNNFYSLIELTPLTLEATCHAGNHCNLKPLSCNITKKLLYCRFDASTATLRGVLCKTSVARPGPLKPP